MVRSSKERMEITTEPVAAAITTKTTVTMTTTRTERSGRRRRQHTRIPSLKIKETSPAVIVSIVSIQLRNCACVCSVYSIIKSTSGSHRWSMSAPCRKTSNGVSNTRVISKNNSGNNVSRIYTPPFLIQCIISIDCFLSFCLHCVPFFVTRQFFDLDRDSCRCLPLICQAFNICI